MDETVTRLLEKRGVTLSRIADLVFDLQHAYVTGLTREIAEESVHHVLRKREVQNAILTGVALDMLAERDELPEPLLTRVKTDEPLFGMDEVLALAITNVYGSIGLTNYGFVDKMKMGVLDEIHHRQDQVNTFLDDIVAGIAAAAAARLAHDAFGADAGS